MKFYQHWRDYPMVKWNWPNFSPEEIACRGDAKLGIDNEAMDKLVLLRTALGRPLIINSGYRSPEYNTKIGGAPQSEHLEARAFDISMSNHDPREFERVARSVGFTGFGFYQRNNFMHIDTGRERMWGTRWWPTGGEPVAFAKEQALQPESAAGDKALVGTLVGAGGTAITAVSGLAPQAQTAFAIGIAITLVALIYVFRDRLRNLLR